MKCLVYVFFLNLLNTSWDKKTPTKLENGGEKWGMNHNFNLFLRTWICRNLNNLKSLAFTSFTEPTCHRPHVICSRFMKEKISTSYRCWAEPSSISRSLVKKAATSSVFFKIKIAHSWNSLLKYLYSQDEWEAALSTRWWGLALVYRSARKKRINPFTPTGLFA